MELKWASSYSYCSLEDCS